MLARQTIYQLKASLHCAVCVCVLVPVEVTGIGSLVAGVAGGCELLGVGAGS